MIGDTSNMGQYLGWVTTGFMAISGVVVVLINNYNSKNKEKATTEKTKMDIAEAIIDRLREEIKDLRDGKMELIKANQDLIALNAKLIETNKATTEQVHQLEIKVQQLSNEVNLLTVQLASNRVNSKV